MANESQSSGGFSGGGGAGTVTIVSIVTSQGVSGVVANDTTTPAITLTLGALTGVTSFNGLVVTANTGAITTGSWAATVIPGQYGGTGVANTGFTITLAGNLTTTGAFNTTFAASATATYTLPTATSTLLANNLGIAGGTTIIGGTAASEILTLSSTSNATKGGIYFGSSTGLNYNETSKLLGIGMVPVNVLDITTSANSAQTIQIVNNTSGTAAQARIIAMNSGSDVSQFGVFSSSTTAVGAISARSSYFYGSVNLVLWGGGNLQFASGGSATERARFTSTGELLIGGTFVDGSLVSMQRNQNAGTYSAVVNTTSGANAFASMYVATNAGLSTAATLSALSAGYTTSGIFVANTAVLNSLMSAGLNIGTSGATQLSFWTNNTKRLDMSSAGLTTWSAAYHVFAAGTATAGQAPNKYTAGTLLGTIESLAKEANAQGTYQTNVALNRYAEGGVIADFITTVDNGTTVETDLFTYTTKANTLAANGEKIEAWYSGTFNDLTATSQLKIYFAGTAIGDTGALTVSAVGGWSCNVLVIRTSSTTARTVVTVNTPGASTALYTSQTDLTGLTLSGTNIIKITGTAAGASGGTGDISGKLGTIYWYGAANN